MPRIDAFILAFVIEAQRYTLTQILKRARLVETEKCQGGRKVWAFALHTSKITKTYAGMTSRQFAKVVKAAGGIASYGANLLKPDSNDTKIDKHNFANLKCSLIGFDGMSPHTWCQLCDLFERHDLKALVDDQIPMKDELF